MSRPGTARTLLRPDGKLCRLEPSAADLTMHQSCIAVCHASGGCAWYFNGQAPARWAAHLEHELSGREGRAELTGRHWHILLVPWLALELVMLVQQGLDLQQVCRSLTMLI